MNWHIGQEIVCIKTHVDYFKEGDTFKIRSLSASLCSCQKTLIDIGFNVGVYNSECYYCKTAKPAQGCVWFDDKNFAPLESLDISELEEVLKEEPFKI